ncbi:MAG: hypothetical protein KAI47_20020 [Deltaproteobacteria bacterium]|nr:hypothetical protein [Deltaproteobacteria bacterium]
MTLTSKSTASTGRVEQLDHTFNGVQVFSATMAKERDHLGNRVTDWIRSHPDLDVVDTVVTQSSDDAFHCLAITLFYHEEL